MPSSTPALVSDHLAVSMRRPCSSLIATPLDAGGNGGTTKTGNAVAKRHFGFVGSVQSGNSGDADSGSVDNNDAHSGDSEDANSDT